GGIRRHAAGSSIAGRPLHPLHRRDDGRAERRALAAGGHLPRCDDRRPSRHARTPPRPGAGGERPPEQRPHTRPDHAPPPPPPPPMHGAAQWLGFGALPQGGTVVLQGKPEKLDPEEVLGLVERERCNTLTMVGDAFARPLVEELRRGSYDVSRLFIIGSGGAILSPHMKEALLEFVPHAMVVDGFGASETGAHGSHAARPGDEAQTGKVA